MMMSIKYLEYPQVHHAPLGRKHSGEWDRFLCQKCEDTFKNLDDYARGIIYSTPTEKTFGIQVESAPHGMNVLNVDYRCLKLYQLSILWKASDCNREIFENVKLEKYEKTIKNMLIKRNPGNSEEFGCIMAIIKHLDNEIFDLVIDMPKTYNSNGWKIINFFYAGTIWLYVISNDAYKFPKKNILLNLILLYRFF